MNLPTRLIAIGLPAGVVALIFGWVSILTLVMP